MDGTVMTEVYAGFYELMGGGTFDVVCILEYTKI